MGTALSIRRLWLIYKRTAIAQGTGDSRRDLALAQVAFYSGARGVLKVLDYMLAQGDYDAAHKVIARFGRQIRAIQSRKRPARPDMANAPGRGSSGFQNGVVFGRMVTFMLQNLRSVAPEFDAWYAEKKAQMRADPLMVYFKDLRTKIEKQAELPSLL